MPFQTATRRMIVPASALAKGVMTPLRWRLDKSGILAGIYLKIRGEITGALADLNPLGKCSVVREVRLVANSKVDIFHMSGPQYHWIVRDMLEHYVDVGAHTDARAAVAAATFILDMWIPVSINGRDMPGLLMLQNESTEVVLTVDFEADANVATNAVVTATVQPFLELFTVPADDENLPPLNVVHTLIGETTVISGAGAWDHYWPRGNTYLGMYYGLGHGVAGADGWSQILVKAAGNQTFLDAIPITLDMDFTRFHGRARPAGVFHVDMLGSTGLGSYGSARDVAYSQNITNLKSVITATGAGTLNHVRRELVTLE